MKKHIVKRGDTLSKIAKTYGVSIGDIMNANPMIGNPDLIITGWELSIPEPIDYEKMGRKVVQALTEMDKLDTVKEIIKLMG